MKKSFLLLCLPFLMLTGCTNDDSGNGQQKPDGYDYIVATDYSDLVKITFKIANIDGRNGETWKVWGCKRGTYIGTQNEPVYPSSKYDIAQYGLSSSFSWVDGSCITLGTYVFNSDTTVYCKYYGSNSTKQPSWRVHYGTSVDHFGWSDNLVDTSYYNAEIRQLPLPSNNYVLKDDQGQRSFNKGVNITLSEYGYTKYTYYKDQQCTQKVTLPFQNADVNELWVIIEK